ncbi:MAG: hypothetical protein PHF86_01965 [Candidatus Nanoarchaeia archaeon]|nr:hypothetical protein [Candidatus Nanoarchaeia archaeon]
MAYVFENLEAFLNEDMGTMKIFGNIPSEWRDKFFKTSSGGKIGPKSEIKLIEDSTNYKKLLKIIKSESKFIIIKVNGISKYLIEQESQNKFKVWDADNMWSEVKRKRDEERKKQEQERNNIKESFLSESRRGHHYVESGLVGSMTVNEIIEFIKKLQTEGKQVEVYAIVKDIEREKISQKRAEIRSIEDPLEKSKGYFEKSSISQNKRFNIFAEKKRAELDKIIDDEINSFKEKVIVNFDIAMKKIIEDLRKGYDWQANPEEIGKKIVSGVDFSGIKKFAQAYKAISSGSDKNPVEASKELKKLGFDTNESLHEWFVEDPQVDGDGKDEHEEIVDPERLEDILELYNGDSEELLEDLLNVIPEEELEKYLDEIEKNKLEKEDFEDDTEE